MSWTAEQLQIAERLDAEVRRLLRNGQDEMGVVAAMADLMPDFKRLMDAGLVNELHDSDTFPWLLRYAKILEALAEGIHDGRIKVPD